MSVCVLTKNDRYYTVTIAVNGGGGGGGEHDNKCLLEIRYPYLIADRDKVPISENCYER